MGILGDFYSPQTYIPSLSGYGLRVEGFGLGDLNLGFTKVGPTKPKP